MACCDRYGTTPQFLTTFNPSKQFEYSQHIERCFMGAAPSLGIVRQAYGDDTAESWLEIQLNDLSEYTGSKEKLTPARRNQLAKVITANFGYLKVTELMLFFQLFKAGRYGKFYGAVDPLTITDALNDFCEYRLDKRRAYTAEAEKQRKAEEAEEYGKTAVTLEEYAKNRGIEAKSVLEIIHRFD